MRNKEERGRVFVCRALGEVTHHGFQKCRLPEGFNYELELGDTLLLKSAVGSCLIHTLSSGWLVLVSTAIINLIHTLGWAGGRARNDLFL